MSTSDPWRSVVSRLTICLIAGGVVISIGLTLPEALRGQHAPSSIASQQLDAVQPLLLIPADADPRFDTQNVMADRLGAYWLLLAVMTLLGLLLVRRWVVRPLLAVRQLLEKQGAAEAFEELGRELPGEFGDLARAIAGKLARLEAAQASLEERERAYEHLYQRAPAAMLSIGSGKRITAANRRAAELLDVSSERQLLGEPLLRFVRGEDSGLLNQALQRMLCDDYARFEMRCSTTAGPKHVVVEAMAVRDGSGELQSIRLSMLDISEAHQLQMRLAHQTRLLNLLVDHISDALLLVDNEGRVAVCNQRMLRLLNSPSDVICRRRFEHSTFWQPLGVLKAARFARQLREMESQTQLASYQRVETRAGVFLLECIPVRESDDRLMGRLWVWQDVTAQEQSQRMISQQKRQLASLREA
ncbi:MAG: PAS domain-containing protein, partial [Rhodospirillales bacterium]|nr:PAS domain-containing protein [Rhodospirillales bacterium]